MGALAESLAPNSCRLSAKDRLGWEPLTPNGDFLRSPEKPGVAPTSVKAEGSRAIEDP